ncbi:MAG: hypothetical protein K0R18_1019 [Bacillales bacterium]|jgi:hypothetical protein|nr:hypothetical protein [Bacillales bacterium]
MFKRDCPNCQKEILYKIEKNFTRAITNNTFCVKCSKSKQINTMKTRKVETHFIRNCPKCSIEIRHTSKRSFEGAKYYEKFCKKCAVQFKAMSKLIEKSSGKNNSMFGKSFYDIWVEKFGEDEARQKESNRRRKISNATSGENNPMYGRPSPVGSGNGWSGYYKGVYFRSIIELSFLKYLIDSNVRYENGEKKKHKIEYNLNGKILNYFPDYYLLDSNEYVEIKPKKLLSTKKNAAKFDSAIKKFGDKFKVLTEEDVSLLQIEEMYELYMKKEVVFIERYNEKIKKLFKENNLFV